MRTLIAAVAICSALLVPLRARSSEVSDASLTSPDVPTQQAQAGEPPPPSDAPPPPEAAPPPAPEPSPAPEGEGQPQAQATEPSVPAGQWVYTEQYGWIWMAYADNYTYAPANGYGQPYQYVYYPVYGWTWIAAPWVWGWGPWPYFGGASPVYFAWYSHGWWQHPSHYHYVPGPQSWYPNVPAPRGAPTRSAAPHVGAPPPRTGFPSTPAPGYRAPPSAGYRGVPAPSFRGGPPPAAGGFRSAPAPSFRGPAGGGSVGGFSGGFRAGGGFGGGGFGGGRGGGGHR